MNKDRYSIEVTQKTPMGNVKRTFTSDVIPTKEHINSLRLFANYPIAIDIKVIK